MVDASRVVYDSSNPAIVTNRNATAEPSVVLTFDDGPGKALPQILDVLKEENVPAVFFWQTRLLYPERPWKRVLQEGHQIGTHTVNHVNLANLSYMEQYRELKNSVNSIQTVTGSKVKYFRPPFGQFNENTLKAANELNLTSVMWKVASLDWELKENPEKIICNVTDHLENGAIILLHELKQTVEILPQLIHSIKEQGYRFERL